MYPWSIDAREAIKDLSEIDDDFIEETQEIRDFLHQDRYYFVIATKGLGKSLLLLAKRRNIKGIECLPKNLLLDAPMLSIETLDRDSLSLLYNEETTSNLWIISIIITIIKNSGQSEEILRTDISESLKSLLTKKEIVTVSGHLGEILKSIPRRQFFADLINDYNTLVSIAQTMDKSVAIFIDNVDECFEKSNRKIWYVAQTGLIRAIYQLVRLNPKLKIFASIRKEAFLKLKQSTEIFGQYDGISLKLSYHKDELKEIFIKNIKEEKENKLAKAELKKENPIAAFIGVHKVGHGNVEEEEDIFDYIYRHTLQRPRDFMETGGAISKVPIAERNPENSQGIDKIKSIINETATKIAEVYIKEISPHLKFKVFDKIFKLIDSNILEEQNVKQKCMSFNKADNCFSMDCKICKDEDKTHIFCELYKIGLLGYVFENPTRPGTFIQKFVPVGEKTFEDIGLLPDSAYYLIHPILDELIRQKNLIYKDQIDTFNIVGFNRPFKMDKEVSPENVAINHTTPKSGGIVKGNMVVEPPFKIDCSTPRLIGKNQKTIPLKPAWYLVLYAMHQKVGHMPIGVLKDGLIATIFLKAKKKRDEEIKKYDSKKVSEQFARSLRRYLKSYGIEDEDAIIKRVEGEGFMPGNSWDKKPTIYGSATPTFYTNKELYKTNDPNEDLDKDS